MRIENGVALTRVNRVVWRPLRERLFTLPWRPLQKTRLVEEWVPAWQENAHPAVARYRTPERYPTKPDSVG